MTKKINITNELCGEISKFPEKYGAGHLQSHRNKETGEMTAFWIVEEEI